MCFQARSMKASIPERARKKSFQCRPWSKRVPFPTSTSTPQVLVPPPQDAHSTYLLLTSLLQSPHSLNPGTCKIVSSFKG